jgi:hypothetical protein
MENNKQSAKAITRKDLLKASGALLGAALLGSSSAASAEADEEGRGTLVGTWLVAVKRPAPLPDILSLQTFTSSNPDEGGEVLEESNSTAIASLKHGEWAPVGHRQFARTMIAFRFDAQRQYLGMAKVIATLELSRDGSRFVAQARVEFYDLNGNLVQSFTGLTETGVRQGI